MGWYAFADCTQLTKIYFNAVEMEDVASSDNTFCGAGKDGTGISVTIGASVKRIPAMLFASDMWDDYPNVVSLSFTSGSVCSEIGGWAFFCSNIKTLTLPASIKTMVA